VSELDVLNVISSTQRRGAEMFATDLVADLSDRGVSTDLVALTAADESESLPIPVLGRGTLAPATLRALRRSATPAAAVIAHGSRTLPACAIALAGTGVPFAYRSIGDPAVWSAGAVRRARTALLLRRARLVIVLWQGAADVLVQRRGVAADRIRIIPNAVAAARCPVPDRERRLAARRRFGMPADASVVACVGSLTAEKQVDAAIAAVARVPAVRLLVAGSGPERATLEATAVREAPGRVHFLGAVATVVDVLAAADAVVLSSRTEGMPGVLIEAGLSTRPSVAFDVGAVSEIVLDGETGALVPVDDVAGLAAAIDRVLGDAVRMGAAAREHCLARFEIGVVGTRWAELVAELAAS
jgi:glycosyltransferase involved in cell wall biosynthesis